MKESSLKYHYQNLSDKSTWIMVTPAAGDKKLNITVQEVGEFFFDGKHYTHRGPLDSFQIAVPLTDTQGTLEYREKTYAFPKIGQMLFLDYTSGAKIDTLGNSHILFIHFFGAGVKYYYDLFYELNGGSPIVPFQSQTVISHIKRIIDLYSAPSTFESDIIAETLILECLSKIIRTVSPKPVSEYSKPVYGCIEIINREYASEISLDSLSERVHISKFHLCRIFKKETGITPSEYLTQIRINKAKELLQSSDLSQEAICLETGICNSSYLCKLFLANEGITPAQYRKKWIS